MIEISGLTKTFDAQVAVDNLSLRIKNDSIFGFLGPNGAGKTTTIKMIVGLTKADAGLIKINGHSHLTSQAKENLGFMPENPYFYDYLTGLEFLEFCGGLFQNGAGKNRNDYWAVLKKVGLEEGETKLIRAYSKGMKQKLGFAQAIINDPEYILLDEPLDGLDPLGRREIKKIIKNLKAEKRTIFFNSHILADVEELCDQIGIIHQGRLLYAGSVGEFTKGKPLEECFVNEIEKLPL